LVFLFLCVAATDSTNFPLGINKVYIYLSIYLSYQKCQKRQKLKVFSSVRLTVKNRETKKKRRTSDERHNATKTHFVFCLEASEMSERYFAGIITTRENKQKSAGDS